MTTTYGWNHWNPPRVAFCTCGWTGRFLTIHVATAAIAIHLAEGIEGCDHAVAIEDDHQYITPPSEGMYPTGLETGKH